jgi:nicotinamidase-related amidase
MNAMPSPPGRLVVRARPFDFALDPGRAALVVIDMQRDFVEPGGFGAALGNDVSLLATAIAPTRALLDVWRAHGWPVVHTRESHAPDLSDCPPAKRGRGSPALRIGDPGPMGRLLVRGEPGCEIVPALAPQAGEIVIDKPGKGAFHATPLQHELQRLGVTQLVFAGVTTEVCVQTTMREANDRGYDSLLVEEATASYFPAFKAATIEMIVAQGGIVGWAAPLAALLAALAAN